MSSSKVAGAGRCSGGAMRRRGSGVAGRVEASCRSEVRRGGLRAVGGSGRGSQAVARRLGARRSPSCGTDRSSAADCGPCGCGAASSGGPGRSNSCQCQHHKNSKRESFPKGRLTCSRSTWTWARGPEPCVRRTARRGVRARCQQPRACVEMGTTPRHTLAARIS